MVFYDVSGFAQQQKQLRSVKKLTDVDYDLGTVSNNNPVESGDQNDGTASGGGNTYYSILISKPNFTE